MKKRTFISLFLVVAMLLCACSAEPNTVNQANKDVEYYYRADAKSVYPLGIDGSITGVAADSEHIFVCGTKNDVPALTVMGYTKGTESHSLSDADIITTLGGKDRAINVSYGAGKFYFLVGTSDESADSETYAVRIYRPDGAEIAVTPLEVDAHDAPKTILPLDDGSDGGDNFTSLFCGDHSMHLIPKTCTDKENAWGFLRLILTEEWQIKDFDQRRICYPGNIHALEAVLKSYNSTQMTENVHSLIDSATLHTHNYNKIEQVFIDSVLPYVYGDMELDTVLNIAESTMRIIAAEME